MIDCAILDKLQQGIILADEQQQIVFANQYILEKLGYKELKEKSIKDILWDEDDGALLDQEEETEVAFKNGAGRKVSARVEVVLEKEEKTVFLIIKEWLEKGRDEVLAAILDMMPYHVWIEGIDGSCLYSNQGNIDELNFFADKKLTKDNIIGRNIREIWETAFNIKRWRNDNRRLEKENILNEVRSVKYKGIDIPFTITKLAVKDEHGELRAVICIKDNKIQIKQMEDKLLEGYGKHTASQSGTSLSPEHEQMAVQKEEAADNTSCALEADIMVLCEYNEEQEKLKVVSCIGSTQQDSAITGVEDMDKETFYRRFFKTSIWSEEDCSKDELPFELKRLFLEGIKYIVQYPVSCNDQLQGVLLAAYKEDKKINVVSTKEVGNICNSLAATIKNNKLAAQFEKELRLREKAERQLQDYIDTNIALYSIFSVKKNKKIMDLGWQALLGWKKPDEISMEKCIYKADRAEVEAKINRVIQGSIEQGVTRFNCKKGGYRWIKWKAKLAEENDGLIMFGMDVTSEVKSAEQRKVYQKALELETTKNEFLANMSHELKTPLNIIYGVLQLMEGDIEEIMEKNKDITGMDKILKHKRIMKQNIFRLLRLINNIVDISKIGAGSYTLNLQNYNIVEVIEDITMSVADYIKDKHLNVVFDTQEEEIETACDSEKIERIMLNLLSNAVKYSKDEGSIQVRMRKLRNKVVIEVSDDGIGIPKEKQDKIFERFVQVDQSFTRKCEGSGIGLCLVKSLVELQGGTISVKSRLGEGSTFTVKLPVRQVEEKVEKLPKKVSTINTRIEKCNIEFSDVYTTS